MLIDEAQDTSPQQWQLVRRLIDDFFAGDGADHYCSQRQKDQNRTVMPARSMFAVGDFKQSIYSFQGADPRVMGDNRQSLAMRAKAANKEFRDVALSVSFRSSAPVLELVNALIPHCPGIEDFSNHEVARNDLNGFVEIWPVVKSAVETKTDHLFSAPAATSGNDAEQIIRKFKAKPFKSLAIQRSAYR